MEHIFLLGAYGQNNLGDDALLEVFLEQLRDARIVVNSAQPAQTSRRYGVESVATYWSRPRLRRVRAMLRSDMVVFGGGSLLKQTEGSLIARLLYFARIFAILLFCKLAGRPSAMLGVGIGPLDRPLYRSLSRLAAELTDLICVRDSTSRDLLLAIGVRKTVHVTADPVFMLTERLDARGLELVEDMQSQASHPTIVVIPRYSLGDAQQTALAAACDHMVDRYGARIRFIPFQTGFRDRFDDLPAARAIQARMRQGGAAEILAAETPRAALDAIGQADLVISARLHGLIFAALSGVASVALDYEVKVGSFMADTGQSDACVSLAGLVGASLPATLDRVWEGRAARGVAVRAQVQSLRERAGQNFAKARELAEQPRGRGALSGGALLFASMTIVNVGNYLFNLVLGRWLGPAAFADLSLIVTLLLMVTLITATLQTISAKFAAAYTADGAEAKLLGLRRWLGGRAWGLGAALLALLAFGAPLAQSFFQTTSAWPFVILGLGLPLYFAQGVDRGVLQGQTRFGALALTYQAEMWVRLVAAVGFVALGWAINGAVAGVALSLAATWLVGAAALRGRPGAAKPQLPHAERRAVARYAGPVVAALVGQVLINNSDILIVKHFFAAEPAGLYAALALIGRIVFFATASVVAVMFPIAAQRQQKGLPHRHLLWLSLGLVALVSLGVIGFALAAPALLVGILFGQAYLPIAPLLWLYAVATALYALANVVINYRLSVGGGAGSALAVLTGLAQVAGLWLFHSSLREVVVVQIFLMAALLIALLVWDWRTARKREARCQISDVRYQMSESPTEYGLPATSDRGLVTDYRLPTTDHQLQTTDDRGLVTEYRLPTTDYRLRKRWRRLLLGVATLAVLLMVWGVARADAPITTHPAQRQVKQILPTLADSEAERAAGAYYPGVGAMISLDLLRGPNVIKDKPSYESTRDWMIYLVQTFGPKLDAVPSEETIGFSVNFYDYTYSAYRQLVITSKAASIGDSNSYAIWLDGKPYSEVDGGAPAPVASAKPTAAPAEPTAVPAQTQPTAAPAQAQPTAAPAQAQPTAAAAQATSAPSQVAPQTAMQLNDVTGPFQVSMRIANQQTGTDQWRVINGKWAFTDQGYEQTELGTFDRVTLLNRSLAGDYRLQAEAKFVEGEMGAGLIFNAPTGQSKNGATMISFTGKGSYLQWGNFDQSGVFQYQGGLSISNVSDGKPHALAVELNGDKYRVLLDNKEMGHDIPIKGPLGGYAGLLASTSHVVFNNVALESK